jgi:hypothetical protein
MSLILPDAPKDEAPKELLPFNCTMCRHFNPVAEFAGEGNCLRYPPSLIFMGMQQSNIRGMPPSPVTMAFFPRVGPLCVCGEFSAKTAIVQ